MKESKIEKKRKFKEQENSLQEEPRFKKRIKIFKNII
jgi:hypothetical protein